MKDYYKEKIGFYKLMLTIFATGFYGVIGWWFINFDNAALSTLTLNVLGIIITGIAIVLTIYKIRMYSNKLKEVK